MVLALTLSLLAAEPPLPTGVPAPVAGNNPFLRQAKELYGALDFEKCLQRLQQAPQWKSAPAELLEIELFAGMCAYNLNQRADAEERFRLALRMNPDAELPPYTSPKLVDFFLNVKRKMRPAPPPMPKEDLDMPRDEPVSPPPQPKVIEAPPAKPPQEHLDEPRDEPEPRPKKLTPTPRAPKPALVPEVEGPSVLHRYRVPIALGVVAVVALTAGIALGMNARSLESRANAARFESDFFELGGAAQTNAVMADVSFGLSGAAALGAALTALFGKE